VIRAHTRNTRFSSPHTNAPPRALAFPCAVSACSKSQPNTSPTKALRSARSPTRKPASFRLRPTPHAQQALYRRDLVVQEEHVADEETPALLVEDEPLATGPVLVRRRAFEARLQTAPNRQGSRSASAPRTAWTR
jgi:hypothetical protein